MSLLMAWGEHIWTRMRRLDYWNPEHTITNLSGKIYRKKGPGSYFAQVPHKQIENTYSIRYFHRDYKRRDTDYYPDTPLTLNHNLMKGKPVRPDNLPPSQVPVVGAFGSKAFATPASMGFRAGIEGDFPSLGVPPNGRYSAEDGFPAGYANGRYDKAE